MNSASNKEQEAKKILEEINNKLQTLKNNPNTHYFGNKNVVGRSVDQKPHITFNIAIYDENQKHDYYITSTTNYRFFLKDVSKDIY